jgi:hypothetical protein
MALRAVSGSAASGAQNASYIAGNWTPTIITDATVGTPAYNLQFGSYEIIGRDVTARFTLSLTGWTGTPTGNVIITGLPVPCANITSVYGCCLMANYTVTALTGGTGITGLVYPTESRIILYLNTATASSPLPVAQTGLTPSFAGMCFYRAS